MWLTLTTTTNNNKFISTVYRQHKEFTKNTVIKKNTNYFQEQMAIFNNYSTSARWICEWNKYNRKGLNEPERNAVWKHRNREGPGARTPSRAREKQSYGCERDDRGRAVQIL